MRRLHREFWTYSPLMRDDRVTDRSVQNVVVFVVVHLLVALVGLMLLNAVLLLGCAAIGTANEWVLSVSSALAVAWVVVVTARAIGVRMTVDRGAGVLELRNLFSTKNVELRCISGLRVVYVEVAPWLTVRRRSRLSIPMIELSVDDDSWVRIDSTARTMRAERLRALDFLDDAGVDVGRRSDRHPYLSDL